LFPQCLEKKIPDNLLPDALKNKSVIIKSTGNRQIDTLGGLKFYLDSDKVSSVNGSYTGTYSCDGDNLMCDIGGSEFIVTGSVVGSGLSSAAKSMDSAATTSSSTTSSTKVSPITDTKLLNTLNFEYKYPGDNAYVYDFVPSGTMSEQTGPGGTWYAKNVKTGKVFDITKNFPKTAEKLNTEYPSAANLVDKSPKNITTVETPELEDNKPAPDVSNIQGKKLEVQPVGSKIDPTQKIDLTTKKTTMKPTTPDLSNLD
jgi:hypothetical protein